MNQPTTTPFRLRTGQGTTTSPASKGELIVDVAAGAALAVRVEVALAAAAGYWHPTAGANRTLPADWAGRTATSLVSGAPVGCLHDAAGVSLFAWAVDELVDELEIKYGVSEEHKTFVLELHGRPTTAARRITMITRDDRMPLAEAVGSLATWLADRLDAPPLPVPPVARRPVYSTWYTFTQDLDQGRVAAEVIRGVELGCGSVFVDDGWQRLARGRGYAGCGDWLPDEAKFPDLAAFSATVHDHGAGVVLWLAPLLLGPDAAVSGELRKSAPHRVEGLGCHILDPRHRQVREHLASVCRRLVVDYDLDGLKIDFLDQAMVYRGTPSAGDIVDVGVAMQALLAQIRADLASAGHADAAVEFRQPYVSPAVAAYGQILRAGDCPGDAVVNRRSTIDARLLSVGQLVHGDMLMWGPTGGPEAVAQQLYSCWFATPQISMLLAGLPDVQTEALAGLLALWQELAPVSLEGTLSVHGSERSFDVVRAIRNDLGRSVIGRYAPVVVKIDGPGRATILNATPEDDVVIMVAPDRAVASGSVRDASAVVTGEIDRLSGGLHQVHVPPYGSVDLDVVAAPA